MEEKLKSFEEKRQVVCKKANIFITIGIISAVMGVILVVAIQSEIVPIFFPLIIAGVVFIVIGSSKKGKLSREFKEQFVPQLVKSVYPDSTYAPDQGLALEMVMEAGLLKRPDRYYCEDFLSASYDDVPFVMSDFTMQERHVRTDSKGNTTVTYETYAKGQFMIIDYKREFDKVLKITSTRSLGINTRGLEKVETESLDFNDVFTTFSSDQLTAFYVLTPQMQLKLLEFKSKMRGSISMAYMKGKLYVAVCNNSSILDINASKPISQETLDFLESQITLPAMIINELGLSDKKYNEGDAI